MKTKNVFSTVERLQTLAETIENKGLHIINVHNNTPERVQCSTEHAQRYYDAYLSDKSYILGNVPAETENLIDMDYNILFKELEEIFSQGEYTSDIQKDLHKLAEKVLFAENFTLKDFFIHVKKNGYGEEFTSMLKDNVYYWIYEVENELVEMLKDLSSFYVK